MRIRALALMLAIAAPGCRCVQDRETRGQPAASPTVRPGNPGLERAAPSAPLLDPNEQLGAQLVPPALMQRMMQGNPAFADLDASAAATAREAGSAAPAGAR